MPPLKGSVTIPATSSSRERHYSTIKRKKNVVRRQNNGLGTAYGAQIERRDNSSACPLSGLLSTFRVTLISAGVFSGACILYHQTHDTHTVHQCMCESLISTHSNQKKAMVFFEEYTVLWFVYNLLKKNNNLCSNTCPKFI